jgi:hypothetical protein
MSERKWIGFGDAGEGATGETEVSQTVTQLATAAMQDAGQRKVNLSIV